MTTEWVLVPKVPTEAMLRAASWDTTPEDWAAMLAAAPSPPPSADDVALVDAFEIHVIKRSRIVATGYADAIEASNQAYVAARAAVLAREMDKLKNRRKTNG